MDDAKLPSTPFLPLIKNASMLRRRLLAMQLQQTIDIRPEEIPPGYKTVKVLISNIQKHYGYYYGIYQADTGIGWKVIRVNNAEEAASYTPKRRKGKTSRQDEPGRIYNMGDAELNTLIHAKVVFALRDIADLSARGISAAMLHTLRDNAIDFISTPGDDYMQILESEATEIKDAARKVLESRLGNLRTMAENTFGIGSVGYRAFRFEGMVGVEDAQLLRLAKRARLEGISNQAAMATWGCSLSFLNQLEADILDFDAKMDVLETSKTDRIKATVIRVTTGNDLYTRLEKICNTGKDVYREISAAKANDYLIYS